MPPGIWSKSCSQMRSSTNDSFSLEELRFPFLRTVRPALEIVSLKLQQRSVFHIPSPDRMFLPSNHSLEPSTFFSYFLDPSHRSASRLHPLCFTALRAKPEATSEMVSFICMRKCDPRVLLASHDFHYKHYELVKDLLRATTLASLCSSQFGVRPN